MSNLFSKLCNGAVERTQTSLFANANAPLDKCPEKKVRRNPFLYIRGKAYSVRLKRVGLCQSARF